MIIPKLCKVQIAIVKFSGRSILQRKFDQCSRSLDGSESYTVRSLTTSLPPEGFLQDGPQKPVRNGVKWGPCKMAENNGVTGVITPLIALDLLVRCLEKVPNICSQMVMKNGDFHPIRSHP